MSGPVLHLLCGKIAAGKSTLAARLSAEPGHVLIVEDDWLATLFGDEMKTGADFIRYHLRLRAVLGPHIVALLRAGVSVVLDGPANTVAQRDWMRGVIDAAGVEHVLHLLDPPDAVCLERLARRNASGTHAFQITPEMFARFSAHFDPPGADEGFVIQRHD